MLKTIHDDYAVSIATAIPIPPPTHRDATPRFFPVLINAYTNVTNTLAPKSNQSKALDILRTNSNLFANLNILFYWSSTKKRIIKYDCTESGHDF